jgi:predicted acylesterase/phospholipase RssA
VRKQKLGIAISGGRARLLPAIGAVQAFDEFGLSPAAVAGCSMGAIVAAAWQAGYSGEELRQLFKEVSFHKLVPWRNYLLSSHDPRFRFGRFSTRRMKEEFFDRYLPKAGQPPRPFELYLYAFDLSTSLPVFWPDTELRLDLKEAALASLSLVPLFTPYQVRDAQGRVHYLADGGYYNPIPAEVLKERGGCGTVIAITYRDSRQRSYHEIRSVAQAVKAMHEGRWQVRERWGLRYVDHLIAIPFQARGLTASPAQVDQAFRLGYDTTMRWLEGHRRELADFLR